MNKLSEITTLWPNGQHQWHRFYQDGKLEGESKCWYKNGQIWRHQFYRKVI